MDYNEIKQAIDRLKRTINNIDSQRGDRHRNIDKCGFCFDYANKESHLRNSGHHGWPEAVIRFEAYSGYYGSSSCSNVLDEQMADYIIKALSALKQEIIDKAIKLVEMDIKKLSKKAVDEANEILELSTDQKTKV